MSAGLLVKGDSLAKNTNKNNLASLVSIPVERVYQNIQDTSILTLIKKDLKDVAGIYAIVHNESKKLYIGSSMSLATRLLGHFSNRSSNIYLQRAISKYGLNNFSVYILELLPMDVNLTSEELMISLIKMEQKHLDSFVDKYNINPLAGKTRKGAKHSEASIELMTKLRKETPYFLNKKHTPEVVEILRAKMVGSNNPMFGKPVTESNKKLISELFSKSIFLYDANTFNLIAKYDKHKDLMLDLNISSKTVVKYKDSGEVFRDKYIISSIELPSNT